MPWNLIAANFLSHILESIANLVNELHSLPLKYAGAHIQLLTSGYSVYPTTSQLVICITCVHLWDSVGLHFFTYSVLRHMFSYPRASPRSLAKMLPGLLWMSWEAAAKRHIGKNSVVEVCWSLWVRMGYTPKNYVSVYCFKKETDDATRAHTFTVFTQFYLFFLVDTQAITGALNCETCWNHNAMRPAHFWYCTTITYYSLSLSLSLYLGRSEVSWRHLDITLWLWLT